MSFGVEGNSGGLLSFGLDDWFAFVNGDGGSELETLADVRQDGVAGEHSAGGRIGEYSLKDLKGAEINLKLRLGLRPRTPDCALLH